MNTPITTALASSSYNSPMTTLGSARRDRAVRRQVRSLATGPGHEHARRWRRSLPPPH